MTVPGEGSVLQKLIRRRNLIAGVDARAVAPRSRLQRAVPFMMMGAANDSPTTSSAENHSRRPLSLEAPFDLGHSKPGGYREKQDDRASRSVPGREGRRTQGHMNKGANKAPSLRSAARSSESPDPATRRTRATAMTIAKSQAVAQPNLVRTLVHAVKRQRALQRRKRAPAMGGQYVAR